MMQAIRRRTAGSMVAELAAAVMLFPVLFLIILASVEACTAYIIKQHMTEAAFLAARALSVAYQTNPNLPGDAEAQQAVFTKIRIPHYVANNAQFSFPNNAWRTSGNPKTVSVICRYASAQYGLAPFPTFSVLNLSKSFKIETEATYRLN